MPASFPWSTIPPRWWGGCSPNPEMRRTETDRDLDLPRWMRHSAMTDPGPFAGLVAPLPSEPDDIVAAVQGLLIHGEWLSSYSVDTDRYSETSRETLSVAMRIAKILDLQSRPLGEARPAASRSVGTCRDYSLVLCSFLRSKSTPARVRCGFASYFGDGWEDHWVCETWSTREQSWHFVDAQLDDVLRQELRIPFGGTRVPGNQFMTSGALWNSIKDGGIDPGCCGHGHLRGKWFVGVNVVRDHLALNDVFTSDWDSWRNATPGRRSIRPVEESLLQDLADDPCGDLVHFEPGWLNP